VEGLPPRLWRQHRAGQSTARLQRVGEQRPQRATGDRRTREGVQRRDVVVLEVLGGDRGVGEVQLLRVELGEDADLVLGALNMALQQRRPAQVIHHSDQGSQYTSLAFGNRCRQMGVRPSMGTVGDAFDNAMAESFFASLECELIDRKTFKTRTEARLEVFTWIEGWYNPRRRHSALGYLSPINFERRSTYIPESDIQRNEPEHTTPS